MDTERRRRLAAGAAALGAVGLLLALERQRPLRRRVEPQWRHDVRNGIFAAGAALTVRLAEKPLVEALAQRAERRRLGLVPRLRLPRAVATVLTLLLLDYTLYVWHVGTHRVPLLWRFHRVHHVDLDLTASTALRFHFIEMLLSVPWRLAQVALIGVPPRVLKTWQSLTLASILFHHSNLRLPWRLERQLARLVVTPRMHGIHHSVAEDQTNSNWSSGLTVWDWLHGTLRLDVPQQEIVVGVPAYRKRRELTLGAMVTMPFWRRRDDWQPAG